MTSTFQNATDKSNRHYASLKNTKREKEALILFGFIWNKLAHYSPQVQQLWACTAIQLTMVWDANEWKMSQNENFNMMQPLALSVSSLATHSYLIYSSTCAILNIQSSLQMRHSGRHQALATAQDTGLGRVMVLWFVSFITLIVLKYNLQYWALGNMYHKMCQAYL